MCNNLLHALGQQSKQYKHQRHNNPQALHSDSPTASVKCVSVFVCVHAASSSAFLFIYLFFAYVHVH